MNTTSTVTRPHPDPLPAGAGEPIDTPREARAGGALVTACFAAATFLGAFLLFLVQPLIAKYVLPWFGGGAAVWASCLLFFQAVLLIGYLYAHLGVRRLPRGAQAMLHVVVLLAAAAAALPAITPSARWQPPVGANPAWRIFLLLAATVGLPCVALAATSPLLHAWYGRLRPGTAVYRLYALSNVGSLLALLAYPLLFERWLTRAAQAQVWSIGLGVFAVLCGACALIAWRYRAATGEAGPDDTAVPLANAATPAALPAVRVALWLALSACASALLMATTNAMTQDFAPVPLLWVIPLALYLLTFIIAFDRPAYYVRPVWNAVFAASLLGTLALMFKADDVESLPLIVGTLAVTLFAGCMVMHGELARLRPPATQLTSYYLTIAAGGALGGLLVAVAAPTLLNSYSEFPIALWACCLLAFAAPLLAARRMPEGLLGMAAIAAVMGVAPLLWTVSHRSMAGGKLVERSRDYYGVLSVWNQTADADGEPLDPGRVLHHGSITHGHQYDDRPDEATTYYYPSSGAGLIIADDTTPLPDGPLRVAVVGLGTGSLAAYARPGDTYRFYDISPNVARVAQQHFTYLPDAAARGAKVDVSLGDARLSLDREPEDVRYDAILLDAFSGDAIPVHLLTSEAFDLYRRRLAPGGMMAIHVSNKFLNLKSVVAAAARRLGWSAYHIETEGADAMDYPADWVVLSPDASRVKAMELPETDSLKDVAPGFVPWTDEWANVMGVME